MLYAQEQAAGGGGGFTTVLIIGGFIAIVYFLMIRPQQKRRKEVQSMQAGMGPGDEVITVGGLYGTIRSIDDESVLLEIAPGVTAKYARAAIGKVNQKAATPGDEDVDGEAPTPGSTTPTAD